MDPPTGAEWEADECRLICQAAIGNTNLRVLDLRAKDALADTLDDAVAHSSLQRLKVRADEWSEECVASVARQLRTNTTLEHLHVMKGGWGGNPALAFLRIVEVLETYNVTLRKVRFRWHGTTRTARGSVASNGQTPASRIKNMRSMSSGGWDIYEI